MRSFLVLLLGLAMVGGAVATAGTSSPSDRAFDVLKSLAGDWEARTDRGSVIRVNYRLIASDSVLVQTFTTASGRQTQTVIHRDGPALLATHYCAQGNQPRLRLDAGSTEKDFRFVFLDATNLMDKKASHLTRLRLELPDAEHFRESETYTADGKDSTDILSFTRVH